MMGIFTLDFVTQWNINYDSSGYPLEFYFLKLESINKAQDSEELTKHIVHMLTWKDRKVRAVENGAEFNLDFMNKKYFLSQHKPNFYIKSIHHPILTSDSFFQLAKKIKKSKKFNIKFLDEIHSIGLWKTTVLPSFLLHILNPLVYPLYDQHVQRAMERLEGNFVTNGYTNRSNYQTYEAFFKANIIRLLSPQDQNDIKKIKSVDGALMAYGQNSIIPKIKSSKKKVVLDINGITRPPSYAFKRRAVELADSGLTAKEAILKTTKQFDIFLKASYYTYSARYVAEWRNKIK